MRIEFFRGGDRERHVAQLVAADQRRLDEDLFPQDLKRIAVKTAVAGVLCVTRGECSRYCDAILGARATPAARRERR